MDRGLDKCQLEKPVFEEEDLLGYNDLEQEELNDFDTPELLNSYGFNLVFDGLSKSEQYTVLKRVLASKLKTFEVSDNFEVLMDIAKLTFNLATTKGVSEESFLARLKGKTDTTEVSSIEEMRIFR